MPLDSLRPNNEGNVHGKDSGPRIDWQGVGAGTVFRWTGWALPGRHNGFIQTFPDPIGYAFD